MEAFADLDDVTEVWGELTVAEENKVEAWLAQASTKLRTKGLKRRIDIDALTATDEFKRQVATDAVVNAVVRVLKNPEGYRQRSTTTGPFTESGTIDTALSAGSIYIAEEDLDGLLPSRRNRIRSFRLNSGLL